MTEKREHRPILCRFAGWPTLFLCMVLLFLNFLPLKRARQSDTENAKNEGFLFYDVRPYISGSLRYV